VLFGVGVGLAANLVLPRLARLLARLRQTSSRSAGVLGLWTFYALAYGALFVAFYIMETRGVAGLLPASLR
jgi:hypothetical protein